MKKSDDKRDATLKQHTTAHTQLTQQITSIQNQLSTVQNQLHEYTTTAQNDQCAVQQLLQEVETLKQNDQGEVQRLLHEVATLKQMITSSQNIHNQQQPQEIQPHGYGSIKVGVYIPHQPHTGNMCGPCNEPHTQSQQHPSVTNHENQTTNHHHMAMQLPTAAHNHQHQQTTISNTCGERGHAQTKTNHKIGHSTSQGALALSITYTHIYSRHAAGL